MKSQRFLKYTVVYGSYIDDVTLLCMVGSRIRHMADVRCVHIAQHSVLLHNPVIFSLVAYVDIRIREMSHWSEPLCRLSMRAGNVHKVDHWEPSVELRYV